MFSLIFAFYLMNALFLTVLNAGLVALRALYSKHGERDEQRGRMQCGTS